MADIEVNNTAENTVEDTTAKSVVDNSVNATEMIIDDGYERIPVKNKEGFEVGVFYFNPTDIGIIDRYNSIVGRIDDIVKPLEDVNINPDGTADENSDAELAALKEAENKLYELCDYLFGGNLSEAFFGKTNPFSPVKGRFYFENALDVVGKFISARFNRETAELEKRVSKYTHGYKSRTGKHRKGKA